MIPNEPGTPAAASSHPLPKSDPGPCPLMQPAKLLREKPTFTLRYVGRAIKVRGSIPWAGNTVIFSEFRLVCPQWAADTSVCGGVVEMPRRTLNCEEKDYF